ncbi:hypothetical protein BDV25DRAFT_138923 [Aspergillus avenaceus]|uniref:Uncharacterized protein n=1 Tax=Aspergillus avenaceus TaxID=36643 RepID=A0A5N6TZB0_ASPAV|nr:hypothetical protein BDV25DRAFT_138923 [Aspergillus avenaceus]
MESPMRVVVYVCVTDIEGNPQQRHITLGNALCENIWSSRGFRAALLPTGYDHVHIPPDFDAAKPVKRWFIFDLNVRGELSADYVVSQVPHQVYLASRQGDKWAFIRRQQWVDSAKLRAKSFTWGGKLEQKVVAGMRDSLI